MRFAAIACLPLFGCAAAGQQSGTPAVIVSPTQAGHDELQAAIIRVLGVPTVTLAPDALTSESTLAIERKPARDASGRPLDGRELGRPELFELVRTAGRCVLVHRGSGARVPLRSVECRPAG